MSGWRVGTASTGATGAALDEARARPRRLPPQATHAEASLHGARSLLDEARQREGELARQLDEQRCPPHGRHRGARAAGGRAARRSTESSRPCGPTPTSWPSASPGSRPGGRARGVAAAPRGRGGRQCRAGPGHGRGQGPARATAAAAVGVHAGRPRRPHGRPRRPPGLPPHAGSPRSRTAWRLDAEARRRRRSAGSSSTPSSGPSTRLAALVGDRLGHGRDRAGGPARASPPPDRGAAGGRHPARRPAPASAQRPSGGSRRPASGPGGPSSTRPRCACGSRPRSRRSAATSTWSPRPPWPPSRPRCPRAPPRPLGSASSSASCGSWARSTRSPSRSTRPSRSATTFLRPSSTT